MVGTYTGLTRRRVTWPRIVTQEFLATRHLCALAKLRRGRARPNYLLPDLNITLNVLPDERELPRGIAVLSRTFASAISIAILIGYRGC